MMSSDLTIDGFVKGLGIKLYHPPKFGKVPWSIRKLFSSNPSIVKLPTGAVVGAFVISPTMTKADLSPAFMFLILKMFVLENRVQV